MNMPYYDYYFKYIYIVVEKKLSHPVFSFTTDKPNYFIFR
jgi:hypothetical protein